jgi:hypothetical protein
MDPASARENVRVACALGELPAIDEALRTAALSYGKVRALSRVATAENEGRLLELALVSTTAQLERMCRGYRGALEAEEEPLPEERSVQRRSLAGGMVKVELVLQPEEAALFLRAVERAQDLGESGPGAQEPRPSRADAAVQLAESFLACHAGKGSGGDRYQVMVHLDRDVLAADGGWAATLEDGSRLSAETLRKVACDCGLVAALGGGPDVGRRTRSIPPALRRALMARDRGCVFPGCTHTRFLHGHHIRHWLHGGETSLGNIVLLCTRHHVLVHEGGWSVERGADGALLFRRPSGEPLAHGPPQPVEDILAWMGEWAEERHLDLGPDVNMPEWDGSRPDYKLAVSGLLEGT